MYGEISYSDIDNGVLKGSIVFVDVRTKTEYEESTIPGAVNMPVMTEYERQIIGTTYVGGDIKKAKQLGVDAGSVKISKMYRDIEKLYEEYDNVVIFCAKGGYRSKTLFYLLRALSMNVYQLKGGYKSYRKYINDNLPKVFNSIKLIVLYGKTGSGKTDILKELEKKGADILDLEGYANHRGSLLGSIGIGRQNSQKMFESLIYHHIRGKEGQVFFTEGESKRIGRIVMQNYMYEKIIKSEKILVEAPLDYRIKNIREEYIRGDNDEEIMKNLDLLSGLISKVSIEDMKKRISEHDYNTVIEELMVRYYDKNYKIPDDCKIKIENDDSKKSADRLYELYF